LPPFGNDGDETYCLLHHPDKKKRVERLQETISAYLISGKSDFTHAVFPDEFVFALPQNHCPGLLNLSNVTLANSLELEGASLSQGLILSTISIKSISLNGATIEKPVTIKVDDKVSHIMCQNSKIRGGFEMSAGGVEAISFQKAEVYGGVGIQIRNELTNANFLEANLNGDVRIKCHTLNNLYLRSAKIYSTGGLAVRAVECVDINAQHAKFRCPIEIYAKTGSNINFNRAELEELLTLTITGAAFSCSKAAIFRGVDFRGSHIKINTDTFDHVEFDPTATMNFRDSILEGTLRLQTNPSTPKAVNLDHCTVMGKTIIRSPLGRPLIQIIAEEHAPDLGDQVVLSNVSLKRCRLLGNSLGGMLMSNVKWDDEKGRALLYDERFLKDDPSVVDNLRETYQVLKENFRAMGDHVTSGDFHYGEMEMTRRKYGWFCRNFGLSGLYYALSGYGTKPATAFRFLCYLLLLFTFLFALAKAGELSEIIFESIELTLQAASFQSLTATQVDRLSIYSRLVFLVARILIPLQAGLLALAIRMRLKR